MSAVSEISPWRAHEWTIVKSAHQPFDENVSHWPQKLWKYIVETHHKCFRDGANTREKMIVATFICFCLCQSKGDIDNEIEGSEWGCGCNYFCTKLPCRPPGRYQDWFTSMAITILGVKFWIICNWQCITKHNTKSDERLQSQAEPYGKHTTFTTWL